MARSLLYCRFYFYFLPTWDRVYGAADPNSGTAALLEVAKGLGKLYTEYGWRPLRSIYLLSWSGEEYGLLGSTGWAELNSKEMFISRALAYLNVDTVVSGDHLKVSASPTLITLWKQVLHDLQHKYNHTTSTTTIDGSDNNEKDDRPPLPYFDNPPYGAVHDTNTDWTWEDDNASNRIIRVPSDIPGILGSGSDYTVFLDHFGIPSLDFSFGKRDATYGQYHSIYDSFAWMDKFGGHDNEPGSSFEIIAFAAKIWGLLAMRLADSDIVPLDHISQGTALSSYLEGIQKQDNSIVERLDFTKLEKAIRLYESAAANIQLRCHSSNGYKIDVATLDDSNNKEEGLDLNAAITSSDKCNERIGLTERELLLEEGLPQRPWFKHVLQAPGLNLGYAAEAFPSIQQAIDGGDFDVAQEQVIKVAQRIDAAADKLNF